MERPRAGQSVGFGLAATLLAGTGAIISNAASLGDGPTGDPLLAKPLALAMEMLIRSTA